MARTLIIASVLALVAGAASAQGCGFGHDKQQAMSCAEGSVWDEQSGTCVPLASS